ncbi:MAG: hypothetical protein WD397_00680 [Wenzhouxiangellaceae bacterium]
MEDTLYKKLRYTKRWFSYFDLLGFAQLVRTSEINSVLPIYEKVLETIEEKAGQKKPRGLSYSWFSDTFIIFTRGSSLEEFGLIEQAARLFFQRLILHKIPVRGAISYGDLYTQQEKNIFLGEALMDAYEYGEEQNWLNFVISPSAAKALDTLGFPMSERVHYRMVEKKGVITHPGNKEVYAYAFNNGTVNGINPLLKSLHAMKESSPKIQKIKYENTIEFIERHA